MAKRSPVRPAKAKQIENMKIAAGDAAIIAGNESPKQLASAFVEAISYHRNWDRESKTLPNG